ncbi:methyltransferase, FkbM family [Marinobacter sp. es.048]|uniref:FkbM family methyltransferase n=1 Tax=Marinobacter sp. es.048 TaxID=1761795 RepID=UPI000B58894B|nr:FkbM family methyltransferase [Marinobacter sp. es.048]SNC68249.1 methyltransferase, FkbM family [Marinobacter sp. es.048]
MSYLRRLLKRLPNKYLITLKKVYYKGKILCGDFRSQEAEFNIIERVVREGDRVIDIGANVGHYTLKLSGLVGREGRVLAFEPISETFDMLTSNVSYSGLKNVTLINGAVSDNVKEAKFTIPKENLYQSYMDETGDLPIMAFALSSFIPKNWNLTFIKIDAEGCDESIIASAIDVLNIFRPIVMSEIGQKTAEALVCSLENYAVWGVKGSHNKFLVPNEKLRLFET